MDVKVVVGGLVVHVHLELVGLDRRVRRHCRGDEPLLHILQPGNVLLVEVPQRPNIPSLNQRQQVQRVERLAIPVQVGQHEKAQVAGLAQLGPVDNVLDLLTSFDNVEYPIESPLSPLPLHIWPDMVPVDFRRLGHEPPRLLSVLVHVCLGARVDKVDFKVSKEVGVVGFALLDAAARHVPVVNVVGAKILHPREQGGNVGEVGLR